LSQVPHWAVPAGEEDGGTIRVSAAGAFDERYVGPALFAFPTQHPEVSVELLLSDRRVDLIGDRIDFAVRHGVLPDSTLVARRIG
jgi:DNA-binding transcriptional LysR family regulator